MLRCESFQDQSRFFRKRLRLFKWRKLCGLFDDKNHRKTGGEKERGKKQVSSRSGSRTTQLGKKEKRRITD